MASMTSKGAPYPVGGDANDAPAYIQQLAEWTDARPGTQTMTAAARAALTGPTGLWEGRTVYESDTDRLMVYTGAAWRRVAVEESPDGGWQTWTPTWTDMTLGNAVMTARYRLTSKTADFYLSLLAGSTTTGFGMSFTLPVQPSQPQHDFFGRYFNSPTTKTYLARGLFSVDKVYVHYLNANGEIVTFGGVFLEGSRIILSGTYEIA